MKLNAPTQVVFLVSAALAVLALLVALGTSIPAVSENALWFALAGYGLLAAANLFKGL